jgi:uncharacterized membrane protein YjgN (DUF898 family)
MADIMLNVNGGDAEVNSYFDGGLLQFNGTAMGLFGNWIKWLLLCIVTVGIYSFWLGIALEKWKVKHTSFAN